MIFFLTTCFHFSIFLTLHIRDIIFPWENEPCNQYSKLPCTSCFVSFNKKLIQDVTLWKILATGAEHLGISITKMFKFFEFPILTGATLIEFFPNLQQVFGFGTIKLFQRLLKGSALFVNLSPNFLYVDLFRSIPKMNFHFFKYS